VRTTVSGAATLITIAGTAPMAYSVRRPESNLLIVDLPGVDASQLAPSYRVASPLVASVTVRRADGGAGSSPAGLHITLRAPARERSHMSGNELVVEILPGADAKNNASGTPVKGAVDNPAHPAATAKTETADTTQQQRVDTSNTTPQTSQGQRYGQPGFVGEPINLNVVNADIRDILNYITEQYGVNFVVDSSVGAVPVTINVTEVPWNFALSSILKANRLGIEVTGNILRVATSAVLVDEARDRASEAAAQVRLKDAELNNSPLVTEFIRLNYARATGTLGDAAGASGGFSGGATSSGLPSGSGVASLARVSSYGIYGDQGILPIIRRRLSRRGGIEVDGRSNTVIITDVQENMEPLRQLIQLLDQPEPQVEIETRIVIANRTFSRDLGVQLGATAVNQSTGGLGSFSTLPSQTARNSGGNPFGTPGGLANTAQSTDALRASGANTVIGLTTGIFGTAQISALISAAEQRGQAKIVATPRVTALNNRPAQIESGSQIPVITPQSGVAGASGVFTTTFVSVPLRLSITPQVTDAGTVVLRVVMENNSVNGTLTNSLGTPGIDTQRMQTEVLVPDGGTTVVGGVLNDRESETQNRTPGLGGIPVIGNLFKRKAISRNTDEILFFITPRIYRPDYQGRRTDTAPVSGPRSVQIAQPVPLGNPGTNATEQQQQTQPQQQQGAPVSGEPSTPQADGRPQTDSSSSVRP
jgi:type IV pilus assembly protein PilQ